MRDSEWSDTLLALKTICSKRPPVGCIPQPRGVTGKVTPEEKRSFAKLGIKNRKTRQVRKVERYLGQSWQSHSIGPPREAIQPLRSSADQTTQTPR